MIPLPTSAFPGSRYNAITMKLRELLPILNTIAPLHLAESWDNVGLLVGDPSRDVTRTLLTIDYTEAVAREAREAGCDFVIAYHPPIFEALKRLRGPSLVFDAIRDGIALYSPHTALDVADGGTNDVLADLLGLQNRRPLRPASLAPWHFKLIIFVPPEHVERLANTLFDAGAGHIGRYSHCSFRADGTGTFLGDAGTHPAIGTPGVLESTREVRFETIVPAAKLDAVCAALRQAHPYEEPAFDIIQLTTPPEGKGMGRIGTFEPRSRRQLIEMITAKLGVSHVLVAGPIEGDATSAACCAGACGNLLNDALTQKADLLLTGEVRHHDALKAAAAGMTVVCALHSNSERLTLQHLAERLRKETPGVGYLISETDADPFQIV